MGGDTPDGSGGSMESARDEEQLALMDRETTGLELVPSVPAGRPTTYGPQRAREETRKKDGKGHGAVPSVDVNPFWSQTLKDEVMLRAMRPTHCRRRLRHPPRWSTPRLRTWEWT